MTYRCLSNIRLHMFALFAVDPVIKKYVGTELEALSRFNGWKSVVTVIEFHLMRMRKTFLS